MSTLCIIRKVQRSRVPAGVTSACPLCTRSPRRLCSVQYVFQDEDVTANMRARITYIYIVFLSSSWCRVEQSNIPRVFSAFLFCILICLCFGMLQLLDYAFLYFCSIFCTLVCLSSRVFFSLRLCILVVLCSGRVGFLFRKCLYVCVVPEGIPRKCSLQNTSLKLRRPGSR